MLKETKPTKIKVPTMKARLNTLEIGLDELLKEVTDLRARMAELEEMIAAMRFAPTQPPDNGREVAEK